LTWKLKRGPYNYRAIAQWKLITECVDPERKSVVDLGCGWGDICLNFARNKAWQVTGYDTDPKAISVAKARIFHRQRDLPHLISFQVRDVQYLPDDYYPVDIILFLSVMPYLIHPRRVLKWIVKHSAMSFIETPYYGREADGLALTKDDSEMEFLLGGLGFETYLKVGSTTYPKGKNERTMWFCT
jgi:2-polyprenyl-3-methyl-5-hydroxy-6-metoxy-1,4-benzoquinol methylase